MLVNFETYDKEHPRVWELFLHFAIKTKAKGYKNYSAKAIFELARWHEGIPLGDDGFKLNNIYTADYARKLMNLKPEFVGFFRTRDLKAKRVTKVHGMDFGTGPDESVLVKATVKNGKVVSVEQIKKQT
jgi:hypothetical protein